MLKFSTKKLPGRFVSFDEGKSYLWFSGTDYLGMGHNEEFRSYLCKGLELFGSHFGSSRNNSLQLSVYDETENILADYLAAPTAITVSSGMWAGQLVMKEIETIILRLVINPSPRIRYYYAPKVHPALWGNSYTSNTNIWINWANQICQAINESSSEIVNIICSDSVGSPWVEEYDFSIFDSISKSTNTWLIIDDSHGLGVLGKNGTGICSEIKNLTHRQIIVVASLNKAMGIPAGVILADDVVIETLRNSPWFSGASPCTPAYMYAFGKFLSAGSYMHTFETLQGNIRYFKNAASGINFFSEIPNYPVLCSRDSSLFPFLLNNGIMASSFPYPSPIDLPVTRLVINSMHQKEDLDKLAEVCIEFQSVN